MSSPVEKILKDIFKLSTPTDKKIVFIPTAFSLGVLISTLILYLIGIGFLTFIIFAVAIFYCFKHIYAASRAKMDTSVVKDFAAHQKFEKQYLVFVAATSSLPILLSVCIMNSSLTNGMQDNLIAGFFIAAVVSFITSAVCRLGFNFTLDEIAKEVVKQEELTRMIEGKSN